MEDNRKEGMNNASKDVKADDADKDVDGGYGFIIVLASFCSHLLVYAITWSIGIFYDMIIKHMDNKGSAQVGFIMSLNIGANYASGRTIYICII